MKQQGAESETSLRFYRQSIDQSKRSLWLDHLGYCPQDESGCSALPFLQSVSTVHFLLPVSLPVVPVHGRITRFPSQERSQPLVGLGGAFRYYTLPRSCDVARHGVDAWRGRRAARSCSLARTNSGGRGLVVLRRACGDVSV